MSSAHAADPTPAESLCAAIDRYSASDPKTGKQEASDAFFQFEASSLDRDLAAREPALYRKIESEWMKLLVAMDVGAPEADVRSSGQGVLALLEHGARQAEAGGSIFLDSLLIILREGFEAILIVSALAAYLMRIGQKARTPFLYGGAGLAVVASVALWFVARTLIAISGAGREAFEGWTILIAAGVLFWVSYWLVSKAEADRWQALVKSQVERAVGRGALFGLGFLSFIVVFREGLETVLFYEAVAARAQSPSDQTMLLAGFLTGCTALAALYAAFQRIGPRIPMRPFFNVTGGMLYFMAFRFSGAGIRELQEAGLVAQTPLAFVPDSTTLSQWFGIYPYAEPLALQALLLVLAVFALAHTLGSSSRQMSEGPRAETRRAAASR